MISGRHPFHQVTQQLVVLCCREKLHHQGRRVLYVRCHQVRVLERTEMIPLKLRVTDVTNLRADFVPRSLLSLTVRDVTNLSLPPVSLFQETSCTRFELVPEAKDNTIRPM